MDSFEALEEYWTEHKVSDNDEDRSSPLDSPIEPRIGKNPRLNGNTNAYQSNRKISTATMFPRSGQSLSPHHPALSFPAFLQQFGPLIFPLYRAALLRKRILFVGEAPVEPSCNFGTI
jgi:hypothetical protein